MTRGEQFGVTSVIRHYHEYSAEFNYKCTLLYSPNTLHIKIVIMIDVSFVTHIVRILEQTTIVLHLHTHVHNHTYVTEVHATYFK